MTVEFERRTTLPTTPERAFDVSLDVDLHLESFKDSEESIFGGMTSGEMALGDTVTWRARHFGIWWTMTSTITEYERPHRFVDEQKKGPFKSFRHVHVFEASDDGSTLMIDSVEFAAPLGVLGRIAEKVALERYLPNLIELRNAELTRFFASPGGAA
jgi:ligand-binding SRPBCC domain-containing protein